FSHPLANRQALLKGLVVGYELRRVKRRSIGFVVGADGLAVRAPSWLPLPDVDKAVQDKADWIVKKLAENQQRQERIVATRIEWKDGAELLFLGQKVRIVLASPMASAGAVLVAPSELVGVAAGQGDAPCLHLGLPREASTGQIRDAVQAWLMRQAKRIFQERLDHFAAQLGVRWTRLTLSNAGTRWGSARADGSIRLHWRLVHYRMATLDYVVAHELSHLRVMNHSPLFWDTVRSVMPGYAEQITYLKKNTLQPWD
ncbi:MAG: M48 family metallopeptidase, partial [Burkholderiaceae bacterium]